MNHDSYADDYLRDILTSARTIAMVGASPRPQRPSHGVMRFLQRCGYRVLPVNPFAAGGDILGERVHASLSAIGQPVDMVDIFRRSELAGRRSTTRSPPALRSSGCSSAFATTRRPPARRRAGSRW